jgi:hypothetical protein
MIGLIRVGTLALILTVVFGTGYVVAQQVERLGADDAPTRLASQLAADPSAALAADATSGTVDLAVSAEPFTIVFDSHDHPIAGSARLDGALPSVPVGVLDAARRSGSNHVSWQPRNGLRFATIERKTGSTVVLAGQSLQPSESRTDQLGLLILFGWAISILICVGGFLLERTIRSPRAR